MGRMIDYTHRADIEIVDNQLLLICNFTQAKKATVMMLFEAVEQILKDIGVGTANSRAAFDSQPRL
jgi:hypothetical protein